MSVKTIGQVAVGTVPVLIAPANGDRLALTLRVLGSQPVFFGADAGVTTSTGFLWTEADGLLVDEVSHDAVWGVASLAGGDVVVWEAMGAPPVPDVLGGAG